MTDSPATTARSAARTLLKRNVKRSVWSERADDGSVTIVKIYHAPGPGALLDRRRARRELRAHGRAAEAGLPVARALGLERIDGRPALRLEGIDGGTSLVVRLESGGPGRRTRIARASGQLFARMEAAGFAHGDPHPGNVLVDPAGTPWLMDLARARFRSNASMKLEQAAAWCAALRERDPRFLAVAARAWRDARPQNAPSLHHESIERRARERRAKSALRRVRAWRRASTRTIVESHRGENGVAQRVVRVREPLTAPSGLYAAPWSRGWTEERLSDGARATEAAWSTLVRAFEHGLPAALPAAVALEPPWFVEFRGPHPATEAREPDARLRERLADRGLVASGPLLADRAGATYIGPATRFEFHG